MPPFPVWRSAFDFQNNYMALDKHENIADAAIKPIILKERISA